MLPTLPVLFLLLIVTNLVLLVPLTIVGGLTAIAAALSFVVMLLAAPLMTTAVRRIDPESIISLRRTFGLLVASTLVWALFTVAGIVYWGIAAKPRANLDEFILGDFLAWSFNLIVTNGAFLLDTKLSVLIAAIHPIPPLLLAILSSTHPAATMVYAGIAGLAILVVSTTFIIRFKSYKTDGAGINSLQIFQSFLKTWVTQRPGDLEAHFTLYSNDQPVVTEILLASGKERAAMVLPGVHPGPFFPVGSYNLSELIYKEIRKTDAVPMVLHGVGGHEKNLPTNLLARGYAKQVAEAANTLGDAQTTQTMKGPVRARVGPTNITLLGFAASVVALVSNSPYNTDDLDPDIIDDALAVSKQLGLQLMLVDAHNCIGGENAEPTRITREEWKDVLANINQVREAEFEIGVAHSSEIGFRHRSDISDGGIGVLLFRKEGLKHALVCVDSNNAIAGLRERISAKLNHDGTQLIELCTSDTHNSAARGLVNRGYYALGEDTNQEEIVAAVDQLTTLAAERLASGTVTPLESRTSLPLIGAKSLQDFASLTERTLKYTKISAKMMAVLVVVLFLATLFY